MSGEHSSGPQGKPAGTCPLCGKPRVLAYRPFCSKRCADVDLNRWLSGGYVVPGEPDDDAAQASQEASGQGLFQTSGEPE